MYETSPVNPALASLLQVANMVTPEQTPTVAAQVASAAGAPVMQPQGMPQGMPQGGQPPQQPGMQGIMRQAQTGGQIQQMQQQQQQQALMQMLQQQQGRENAMRFGVAAAPGAQSVRMAEGGIVGYAEGGVPHELNDPDELKKMRERLARRAYEDAKRRATTAAPAASRGIMSALGRLFPVAGGVAATAADPQNSARSLMEMMPLLKMLNIGMGDPADVTAPRAGADTTVPTGDAARADRALGLPVDAAEPTAAAAQAAPQPRPPAGPGPGPGGPGAAAPQLVAQTAPMGPSQSEKYLGDAQTLAAGIETALPSYSQTSQRAQEAAASRNAFLQSQGVDPQQYQKDIEESRARETRKLGEIGNIARQREEARTGMPGLIALLTAAGGRTDPLTAIGQKYGNIVTARLEDNERFMNARERVKDSEAGIQAALRDKQRAEANGQFDKVRAEEAKEMELRNKKREAQITLATETYKVVSGKEERATDRALTERLDMMKIQAQREATAAQKGQTNQIRIGQALNTIMRDEERLIGAEEDRLQKALQTIGIFPGVAPNKDQQQQIMRLTAERDANVARIRKTAAESRATLMGGSGGEKGSAGIEVLGRAKP